MAVNKVIYGTTVLVDLTDSDVTPESLLEGVTAYDKTGSKITGTLAKKKYVKEVSGSLTASAENASSGLLQVDTGLSEVYSIIVYTTNGHSKGDSWTFKWIYNKDMSIKKQYTKMVDTGTYALIYTYIHEASDKITIDGGKVSLKCYGSDRPIYEGDTYKWVAVGVASEDTGIKYVVGSMENDAESASITVNTGLGNVKGILAITTDFNWLLFGDLNYCEGTFTSSIFSNNSKVSVNGGNFTLEQFSDEHPIPVNTIQWVAWGYEFSSGEGLDTSDATATAPDILTGKTAYGKDGKLTGSMLNNGAVDKSISNKSESYTIPQGYHNGSGKVAISESEQAKIIASNIKKGVSILGVTGSYEATESGGNNNCEAYLVDVTDPTVSFKTATGAIKAYGYAYATTKSQWGGSTTTMYAFNGVNYYKSAFYGSPTATNIILGVSGGKLTGLPSELSGGTLLVTRGI